MRNKGGFRLGLHPLLFFLGYKRLRVGRDELESFLNLCVREQVSYHSVAIEDDYAYICVPFFGASRLIKKAERMGISAKVERSGGIPALTVKHRGRLGLFLGALFGVLLIALSGTVVWDVRVDGEKRLTEEEVIYTLEQCGLKVGVRRASLDIDVIENRVLILSDDISWISINMRGTVANVEIRELVPRPDTEDESGTVNLVAERGGVITRLEDIRGNIAVSVGDSVSEGQLLVGGIYGDEETGIKYTAAKGRVYAECEDSFSVQIPRKYIKKMYTGRVKCEKYLIFFKNEIKFFSNCGNLYTSYDKIDMIEYFPSPGGDDLPVGIRTVKYMEYVCEEAVRSDGELSALADYRMSLTLSKELSDADLLRKNSRFTLEDDRYTLVCRVVCVKDIAKRKIVEVLP